MALIPYLSFNGNAKEVIDFYVEVFGLEGAELMYFKDMPEDPNFPVTAEMDNLVMHGSIDLDGNQLMFSDSVTDMGATYVIGNNIDLMYSIKDSERLQVIYDKLSIGGEIIMPFAATFFSPGYAKLVDKYGIGWQLNVDDDTWDPAR